MLELTTSSVTSARQTRKTNIFPDPEAEAFLDDVCALSLLLKDEAIKTFERLYNNLSDKIWLAQSTTDFAGYFRNQWAKKEKTLAKQLFRLWT